MNRHLEQLQGSWKVTGLEMEGQPMPAAMLESARIVVEGNGFTSTGMGAEYRGTIALDPSATPAQLDMKFDAGPEKGATNFGIYEITGETWRLCLALRGAVRPSSFVSIPGSGFALETLARDDGSAPAMSKKRPLKKVEPAAVPGTGPATEFDGEWSMVSGVMNGAAMDESMLKWVKRVIQGNQSTVTAGPQVMLKVEFTSDSSKSPGTIDYLNLAGANKGKTQLGIYEMEGDLLKICVAPPGDPRPAAFQSAAGSGATLTVWKRK